MILAYTPIYALTPEGDFLTKSLSPQSESHSLHIIKAMKKKTQPTTKKRNVDRARADRFTWQDGDIEFVPEPALKLKKRTPSKSAKH